MKKIILIVLLATFSCKNEKKASVDNVEEKVETKKEIITKVDFPPFPAWGTVGISLEKTPEIYVGEEVYLISRNNDATKSSYTSSRKVSVDYAEVYRASAIVKKSENGNLFGLRIMGDYPDRVDAVFDLEEGTIKGVEKTRDFESENATIEVLGDGWYKCSVVAKVVADKVNIFFGPSIGKKNIGGWTIRTPDNCDVYILPSSLTLEKVSIEKKGL